MNDFYNFLNSEANRPLLLAILIVDLILRGLALYRSANKGQRIWFVSLLVLNTMGILPLIYLLWNMRSAQSAVKPLTKKSPPRRLKK